MTDLKMIVVDDEPDMAQLVCDIADRVGFNTEQYHHAEDFINAYSVDADVIALDLMMPNVDGVELIRFLAEQQCAAQLVLISGFDSGVLHSAQELAIEQGLHFVGSLQKPFRFGDLSRLLSGISEAPRPVRVQTTGTEVSVEELQTACDEKQLEVYYQPQIDLKTGRVVSVEALTRWQHPQRGLIMPDQFIELAEQNGLIDSITWRVFEQVVDHCHCCKGADVDLRIAVNMSAKTLMDLELPDKIDSLVRNQQLAASQVILEITETALMDELARSLDILTRLRMKGFDLSIDDFGTGYSSMVQLHRVPFSEIKIDKSFVMEMDRGHEALAIVETIIMLAHKLGMKAVAEGVESASVLEKLTQLGCDRAQGYHIARPMPADALFNWMQNYP